MNEALYGLITEEAFYHTLLPLFSEITGDAMFYFGGYDMQEAVLYAFTGAALAVLTLYGIGRLAASFVAKWLGARYEKLKTDLKWILPLAAFGVMSPLGFVIAPALGLFKAPAWLVLPIALLTLWFGYWSLWVGEAA